ncbi:MAG: hypothetical protein KDI79_08885 [Anaerolineae bacterium]|nr:hypothetical protein [Anaerolineae bacterium]
MLIFLSMSVGVSNGPAPAAGPTVEATVINADSEASFREKIIAEFGLTDDDITIAAANLSTSVSPTTITKSPNDTLSFTVTIKNNGASQVSYIFFNSEFPKDFVVSNYQFSGTGSPVVNNGQTTWFIPGPLAANGGTATITINGKVAANACNRSDAYKATVYPLFEETNIKQSTSTLTVINSDSCGDLYFPYISRFPTPTPQPIVYQENFSDEDNDDWPQGKFNIDSDSDDDCAADINSGTYEVTAYDDETCFLPGPKAAERTTGTFEVEFKRDGDGKSEEFDAGIYINGEGGDEYYLFKIEYRKDNCDYRLYRHDSTKASGDCEAQSNGYNEKNKLRITRTSNGSISIYLNDKFLKTYTDGSPYGGKGTGVYLRERSNDNKSIVDFDNFTVYRE